MAGANASANRDSLLQTCKVNRIGGHDYLRKRLSALPMASTVGEDESLLHWRLTQ